MSVSLDRRVLITGASGLLGRALVKAFEASEPSWKVIGLANSRARDGLLKVDLLDAEALRRVILENKPTAVIHSAAERNCNAVDDNYDAAYKLNVEVSKQIAQFTAALNAVHVYISTDYVFDGCHPPYKETDATNPLNKYGSTKLEGEKVTLNQNPKACILRVPVLYGQVESLEESVVTALLDTLLNKGTSSKISDYEIRYPTHVDDVATTCQRIVEEAVKDPISVCGIFHCSGKEAMTKFKMVEAMAEKLSLPMDHVLPDANPSHGGAPRPYNCHLDCGRLETLLAMNSQSYTGFREGIQQALMPFLPQLF